MFYIIKFNNYDVVHSIGAISRILHACSILYFWRLHRTLVCFDQENTEMINSVLNLVIYLVISAKIKNL